MKQVNKSDNRHRLSGGCHCGAVRFSFLAPEAPELLDCNCSICSSTGYLHLIVPHEQFRFLTGEKNLTSYRFGTEKADHLFCEICGVKSFYQPRSHPDSWSVNARCLDLGIPENAVTVSFDGRNWEAAKGNLDRNQ